MGNDSVAEIGAVTVMAECLACPDSPCTSYSPDEAEADVELDVTRDPRREVCVFEAIAVDVNTGVPEVIDERCSGCGLCVERCPAGAIRWSSKATAAVQGPGGGVTETTMDLVRHTRARKQALAARETFVPTAIEWQRLRERFDSALEGASAGQVRLLVRNLIRGLGASAHSSVRGDTSDRTEITAADGGTVLLAEIGREVDLLKAFDGS